MKVRFVERKVKISDDLKRYTDKKCQKLDRYFGQEAEAQVTYSILRGRHTVEITVIYKSMFFRAEEQTADMYASVDGAISSLDRQIQKNKTRLSKRTRQNAFETAEPISDAVEDQPDEEFELVRTKELVVKPMTAEDAIMQMNLLSHEFFFFINSDENNKYCVVYKRKNGGYGMLIAKE